MRIIHLYSLSFAILLGLSACGTSREAVEPIGVAAESETLHIAITDTIGVELGDSNYVFGTLMQVGYSPDGDILVLDLQRGFINVYSRNGVHKGTIGRHGPGPGEFEIPLAFAVFPDGGVAVTDVVGRDISFFDSQFEFKDQLSGFAFGPPMSIAGCPDGSLVGQHMSMVFTDDGVEGSQDLSRWEDLTLTEPAITYLSSEISMSMDDQGAQARMGPSIDYMVGPDGSIAVVEISDTLFSLIRLSPDGEELLSIVEERDRVPRTQEELDAGSFALGIVITGGGASASSNRVEDVYPWRNIIASVGIDAESRIWVELACEDSPVFSVFDYSGNMLFTAVIDTDFDNVNRPDFVIESGGFLAFDRDPLDYPKIYVLELLE